MEKSELITEMDFCLELWEKQGYCKFGGKNNCENCAVLYLLEKLISGKVNDSRRLDLNDWKKRINELKVLI
jgi:hypothetical protein